MNAHKKALILEWAKLAIKDIRANAKRLREIEEALQLSPQEIANKARELTLKTFDEQ